MFWREKLKSLIRPRHHLVSLAAPERAARPDSPAERVIKATRVREGAMLLDALLKRGVEYPHLCKLGDCQRCKSKLLSGCIRRGTHYEGALTPAEEQAGIFLACRATPLSDCTILIHGAPRERD
jgi:ferredoxin